MNSFTSGTAIVLILGTTACASSGPSSHAGLLDDIVTTDQYYSKHTLRTDPKYGMEGFVSTEEYFVGRTPPMAPERRVTEQDCTSAYTPDGANLHCK